MNIKSNRVLTVLAMLAVLIQPFFAFAADIDVHKILCNVAGYMFDILMTVSTIMVIYAAYLYVTGRDNAEKISKAHKTLLYAAVAVIVVLLAQKFPVVLGKIFGVDVSGC